MTGKTRVLIADDQRLFADGLRVVIESRAPQFEVVGIASDGRQAVGMVRQHRPDIVLMDVRMPEMDGVEATRLIHEEFPDVKILILTTFSDDEYVKHSIGYGAIGYLLKNRPAEELISSMRALSAGILQIDPAVSVQFLRTERDAGPGNSQFLARLRTLSPREREILSHMVKAQRIAAIAADLAIAEQTVRNHISNIYSKLDIHDRLEIVKYINLIIQYLQERNG